MSKMRTAVFVGLFLFQAMLLHASDYYVALSTLKDLWILRIDSSGNVLGVHQNKLDYASSTVGISPITSNSGTSLAIFKPEIAVDVTQIESGSFTDGNFSSFQDFGGRVLSGAEVLQVTQKTSANWLLGKPLFHRLYQGLGINSSLQWNGKIWPVSPALKGSIGTASVSSDGRMFTESLITPTNVPTIVSQPLLANGHRQGQPQIIPLSQTVTALDCSNILPGGVRYIVYRTSKVQGIDTISSQLFLHAITANTGKPVGISKPLTRIQTTVAPIAEPSQSVAIDPAGKFVLYTSYASVCGKNVLKFQPLIPTPSGSSSSRVIFGCNRSAETFSGVAGIDISALN